VPFSSASLAGFAICSASASVSSFTVFSVASSPISLPAFNAPALDIFEPFKTGISYLR
jgi:hypothetical protein